MPEITFLRSVTIASGLASALIGIFGVIGSVLSITLFISAAPGYKAIAFSAAVVWIFLGFIIAVHAYRPFSGTRSLVAQGILTAIVLAEGLELFMTLAGAHSPFEVLSAQTTASLFGTPVTYISPVASALIIPAAIALIFLLGLPGKAQQKTDVQDGAGIAGFAIALVAFTYILSYAYGAPFLYNSPIIPIALPSAFAGFFLGVGVASTAGKNAFPVKYFVGGGTQARLLRVFVPLVIVLTIVENVVFYALSQILHVGQALILAGTLVLFTLATVVAAGRISRWIGGDLERAENTLLQKNEDLGVMNEELNAMTEELQQSNDGLIASEASLRQSTEELKRKNEDLEAAYEEITASHEELQQSNLELMVRERELSETLSEKEALLSEIHHRVKNNLTAFISLLSLEGAYDNTPSGIAMKTDLQNRARSMALIHETLYKTNNFSQVDMQVYLSTLVDQIVRSYGSPQKISTVVEAEGITLDLSRATPTGLIVNELITNSLKYAFPEGRSQPEIMVCLQHIDSQFNLTIKDNGIGLPKDFSLLESKTLGLKLVNFLARHQLRAHVDTANDGGALFRFTFKDKM